MIELEQGRSACAAPVLHERILSSYGLAERHAKSIWLRIPKAILSYEDILQYALVGLAEAAGSFVESRGIPFEAYAGYRIRGNILNNLRYQSEDAARYYYLSNIERSEYFDEIKRASEEGDVFNILIIYYLKYFLNGDAGDVLAADYIVEEDVCLYDRIFRALNELSSFKREIIYGYYLYQSSMEEIAGRLGITRARVSQIHKEVLQYLRAKIIKKSDERLLSI